MNTSSTFDGIYKLTTCITHLISLGRKVMDEIQHFVTSYKNSIPLQVKRQLSPEITTSGLLGWRIKTVKTQGKNPLRPLNLPLWTLRFLRLNGHYTKLQGLVKRQSLLNKAKKNITSHISSTSSLFTKLLTGEPLCLSPEPQNQYLSIEKLTSEELEGLFFSVECALLNESIALEQKYQNSAPRDLFARLKLLLYLEESKLLPVWYLYWHLSVGRSRVWIKELNLNRLPRILRPYKNFLTPFMKAVKNYNLKRYRTYSLISEIYRNTTRIIKTYSSL